MRVGRERDKDKGREREREREWGEGREIKGEKGTQNEGEIRGDEDIYIYIERETERQLREGGRKRKGRRTVREHYGG